VSGAYIDSNRSGNETLYRSVRDDGGFYPFTGSVFALRGRETLEFINRISTNDVRDLPLNHARPTILLNEKGRFVDCVDLLHLTGEILLISSGASREELKRWIERFIIMEDITILDRSPEYSSYFLLEGRNMAKIRRDALPSAIVNMDGSSVNYASAYWPGGYIALVKNASASGNRRGGTDNFRHGVEIPGQMVEVLRIEAGIPRYGAEITADCNPLEAGLRGFISYTKGCYTGQEVIARIDSYQKLQKQLIGVRPDTPLEELRRSMVLRVGAEVAGHITSACWSPGLRSWIAMGYLKTSVKSDQLVATDGAREIPVRVTAMPFIRM